MTDTVVAEGQVKFRDGKKVNSTAFLILIVLKYVLLPPCPPEDNVV